MQAIVDIKCMQIWSNKFRPRAQIYVLLLLILELIFVLNKPKQIIILVQTALKVAMAHIHAE